jgi:hypothetical protein
MHLSEAQVAGFHREGYLVVQDLLTREDLQPVIDEICEAVDQHASALVEEGVLSRTYAEEGFETRLTRITAETERLYWAISSGKLAGRGVFSLLSNAKVLDVAESLVGPEIVASSVYRLRPKVPGFAHGVVPWHQDSGYFEPYCDTSLILTVWVPLVDATPERGCLQVMPRVHRDKVFRHARTDDGKYLVVRGHDLPDAEIVTVPVPFGGALLVTNRTPHCSIDNVTDVIRWSADLRYQSADLPTNYAPPSGLPLAMQPEDAPVACYPPEADFLVRSRRRPQDVVTDWQTFGELRRGHSPAPVTNRWSRV